MPTSNRRLPKAAAPAYAAPAPTTRPVITRNLSRISRPSTAAPGFDLEARRVVINRFGERNPRTVPASELCAAINELHRSGCSLSHPYSHLGRTLLQDLTNELTRREAVAAEKPVQAVPIRAGGYSAAVAAAYGPEGFAQLVIGR